MFCEQDGLMGCPHFIQASRHMPACEWWDLQGGYVPQLQQEAKRSLAQCCGVGASARGHKEMNFIKSKTRNRLGARRLDQMIYSRCNMNICEKAENCASAKCPQWEEEEVEEPIRNVEDMPEEPGVPELEDALTIK